MELQSNKIYAPKELANWFGVKPHTFSNTRIKKLEILKQYCDFEDLGNKGIKVTKVHMAEYAGNTRKIVEKDFKEAWTGGRKVSSFKSGNNLNTIKETADYIYKKNEKILNVKPVTIYNTTCAVKRDWYGIPKIREGSKGRCKWVYCAVNIEKNVYRYLTEEEQAIKKEMLEAFFKDDGQRTEELKKLQQSKKLGEISDAEYIQKSEEILGIAENGNWDKFNKQFMERIGVYCDFVLELEDAAYAEA